MYSKHFISIFAIALLINACKKEDTPQQVKTPFFEQSREVILSESFDSGLFSETRDEENFKVINSSVFVANGYNQLHKTDEYSSYGKYPCDTFKSGALIIGCVSGVKPHKDSVIEKTYHLAYIDTLFNFETTFTIDSSLIVQQNIGIQLDYRYGGITEFQIGNLFIKNYLPDSLLDGQTIDILIDQQKGSVEALLNKEDISWYFLSEIVNSRSYQISFKVKNNIEMIAGVRYISNKGMSIDKMEVYTIK